MKDSGEDRYGPFMGGYVPLSVRSSSWCVSLMWRYLPACWLPYNRASWLARRLP